MINKEFIGDDVWIFWERGIGAFNFFLVYFGCHWGVDKVPEEVG
jgi:hypothetical protein